MAKITNQFYSFLPAAADGKEQTLSLTSRGRGRKRTLFTLVVIILLATFLRFYKLGQIPPSLDWDEVSLGYNAWALSETGRDEFGNSWPLSIRSFGDYKPPLYTYLLIPSLKIFGRTEFAIRFPSALAGTLTVLTTYFLAKELFRSRNNDFSSIIHNPSPIGLISAFLLAISPWHLQFSRIAFEANVGLFFFVTGMWLLMRALHQNSRWSMFFSVASMSAAMMAYHSSRIVVPLVVLATLWIYGREFWALLRKPAVSTILSTVLTVLTVLTISYTIFFQNVGQSRFSETSFLTIDDLLTVSRQRIEKSEGNFLDRVANHRFLVYGRQYLKGYLDHYNLRFWFLDGDRNDRHRTPGVGLLYWWEFPLLVMGFVGLTRKTWGPFDFGTHQLVHPFAQGKKSALTLIFWLLLAPSAAALTGGTPSAVRSLVFLPTFQIIEGVGTIWLIRQIVPTYAKAMAGKRISRMWSLFLISYFLLLIFETSYYFHQYYVQAPIETAPSWQYGYKQLVGRIMSEKGNYEKVIVTTAYDQPYIYFLWYGNYDPGLWINNGEFNKGFDKFEFRKIEWDQLSGRQRVLVVLSPDETKGRSVKWQINFPDGKAAFNAIEL